MRNIGQTALTKLIRLIKSKFDGLATVATTGSYNDLSDKPTKVSLKRSYTEISSDGTSVISLPITPESVDNMLVYQNGVLLTDTVHYTATTSSITLNGYSANSGDLFTFVIIE